MRLILLLLDDMGTPTAWMTAASMEALLAFLHPLARRFAPYTQIEQALRECPPGPERAGRIALGVYGERHAWLLSEISRDSGGGGGVLAGGGRKKE